MTHDSDEATDLFEWNRRVYVFLGAWPLQPSYVKFGLWIVYYVIHMASLCAELLYVFGNLELMVMNIVESTWSIMIISKLLVMRFSRRLANLTKVIVDSLDRSSSDSSKEMKMDLKYTRLSKMIFKIYLTLELLSSGVWYIRPLIYRLQAVLLNGSMPFVLANRGRYFFEVNDSTTFWLLWIYQLPLMYFNISLTTSISYLLTLSLHVCGQLTILALRIKNLHLDTPEDKSSRYAFRKIVTRHHDLLGMIDDINGVFGMLILEELTIMTVLLGLSSYSAIVNVDVENPGQLLLFLAWVIAIFCYIYGYCLAGEYLVIESMNLFDAYFQCRWYDMSGSFKKQLIICMMKASKPAYLTAGGYYNVSLESFTNILKTSAGYISLLRAMI